MKNLNLLIVEDDETQIQAYLDTISQFNKNSAVQIIPNPVKTFEGAEDLLKSNYYDAAIIDLRLASNSLAYEGVELIKSINGKLRIPLYAVSASLGQIEDIEQNLLLQKRNRTDSFKTILEELLDIYNSGITTLLRPNSFVDNILTKIFWNHLPFILEEFIKEKKHNPGWDIEKVLLRYIASHINEYLELNNENNFEPFNSNEFYIKPSIKENNVTGQILQHLEDKSNWIILTPVCDLVLYKNESRPNAPAKPKAKFITIAHIDELDIVQNGRSMEDKERLKQNSIDFKYHYLPQTILFKGGFINFQRVQSIPINIINNDFSKELIISYPFKKDIISRFANYYARQGQPTFS